MGWDEQWADTGMCSNVEIARVNCAANIRPHQQQQKTKDEDNRLMWSEGISRPIPRSEKSVQVNIVQKFMPEIKKRRTGSMMFWLRGAQMERSTQQPA